MSLRRKGSAPWSLTKETGLSDAPVSGSPFVEGDEVKPVIDAGYIDEKGLWQINPSSDRAFTFQDPSQALAAGASLFIEGIDTLNHDILLLAILDASGNAINVDIHLELPGTPTLPYSALPSPGIDSSAYWRVNTYPPGGGSGSFENILIDSGEGLPDNLWTVFKIVGVRGLQANIRIRNNDGSNAGTISTAYLRLV